MLHRVSNLRTVLAVSGILAAAVVFPVVLGHALPVGAAAGDLAAVPGRALPMDPDQGVQVSGLLTYTTSGTCLPDAVLLDCSGNPAHELKGPGGAGFFAAYLGQWVDINGAAQECQPGSPYIDVVTIQTVANPCGTPTATPMATPTLGPSPTPGATMPPTPGPSPTPPAAGNLAFGRMLYASTTQPGSAASFAADGDPATFWSSEPGRNPYYAAQNQQWIYIDLGQDYVVDTMRMRWNTWKHARGYTVYAWLDYCGGWCRLASTTRGDGDDQLDLPVSVETQYFMLWLVNPALMGGNYELNEWEIGGQTTIQTTNVAAGKSAVALNHVTGFDAARAVDADDSTDWQSAGTPTWIYVNLGSAYTVDRARLKWSAGAFPSTYSLYGWSGTSWAPLTSRSGVTGADEIVRFPTLRTQYVLLYAPPGSAAGNVGLREFEIYETSAGTPGGGGPPAPPPFQLMDPDGTWNGLSGGGRPDVVPQGLPTER